MEYHFRNLVFEGGGVKGIAYVGALEVLQEKGILGRIRRVGGTSAGAIIALMVGLNYDRSQMLEIMKQLDFRQFLDDTWGIVRDIHRLVTEFGWFKGDFFRNWIGRIIAEKTGNSEATFNDVYSLRKEYGFPDMYFLGTNLSTGFSEVFSYEHTPRMCIADAIRISMSIPFFFAAPRNCRGDVFADGGVLNNYPVRLFDRQKYVESHSTIPDYYGKHNNQLLAMGKNISLYVYNQETLGFRLDSGSEIAIFRDQAEPPRYPVDDFFSYAWRLVDTIIESQQDRHLQLDDWHRTIYIDTLGVQTMDFAITAEKKQELRESGRRHAAKYFDWYDNAFNRPHNRPAAFKSEGPS